MVRSQMRRGLPFVIAVIVVAGCGSKKEGDGEKTAAASDRSADLSTLFTGTTVTLPEEVAKATFGAAQPEVASAIGTDTTYKPSKLFKDVSFDLEYSREQKKLEKISINTNAALEPLLTKQWGPPIKTKKGEAFWFDPKTNVRAWLPEFAKGKRVAFSRYDSLAALLGPTGFELAFATGKPLIGAKLDELEAAWGGKLCDFRERGPEVAKAIEEYRSDWNGLWYDTVHKLRLCLALPRFVDEGTPFGDTLYIGRMGRVEQVELGFRTGGAPELTKEAIAFFDAKFGKPVEVTTPTGAERWYFDPAGHQRAKVSFGADGFSLFVGRYLPVAELLAADKPGVLGVATKSMPGGAPAAIAKEDPEHFNAHGTLPRLVFPASDFGLEETEVELESWDKEPKTYGYRVVLHHTNNEPAGDAVFALLEKKLGPAKKDPDHPSTDADQYFAWKTKDGQKVSGRRVSQQWQLDITR